MKRVIDASMAYGIMQSDSWDDVVGASIELIAPDLIIAELLNARWKAARLGRPAPSVNEVLEFAVRVRILPSVIYGAGAAKLADRLDHPIYDCLYVAAAQQENAKLLTADKRLAQKLRTHRLGSILAAA
jgi:predicted nucleic acid-binding protein